MTIEALQEIVGQFYHFLWQDKNQPVPAVKIAGRISKLVSELKNDQPINEQLINNIRVILQDFWSWAAKSIVKDDWRTNGIMSPWLLLQQKLTDANMAMGNVSYPFFFACLRKEADTLMSIKSTNLLSIFLKATQSFEPQSEALLFILLDGRCDDQKYKCLLALIKTQPDINDAIKARQQALLTEIIQQRVGYLIKLRSNKNFLNIDELKSTGYALQPQLFDEDYWQEVIINALEQNFKTTSYSDFIIQLDEVLQKTKDHLDDNDQKKLANGLYQFSLKTYRSMLPPTTATVTMTPWNTQTKYAAATKLLESRSGLTFFEGLAVKQGRLSQLIARFDCFNLNASELTLT